MTGTTGWPVDPALRVGRIRHHEHLTLVEVNGELTGEAVERLAALLRAIIAEGARGIAVDLRGCREVDPLCVSSLLAAEAALEASEREGVALIVAPDSSFTRRLRTLVAGDLPVLESAAGALVALGDPPTAQV